MKMCVFPTQTVKMTLYFRRQWYDLRLRYDDRPVRPKFPVRLISPVLLKNIWQPDLYFPYLTRGFDHAISMENEGMWIYPDGKIFLSSK